MSDTVVSCRGVGKVFKVPRAQERTLRGRLLHPSRRSKFDEFRALESVDVEIRKGEFFGVVGRNGSGKSTLLKILAGIYRLDEGEVEISGTIAPFIELGVGFNEDLSARDNVFINGAILGMGRREIADRFDAIVDFAELEEFMDARLRNFSSGMLMRLAFAIAVQSGAEILLIDEVLAVGDGRFQRKCQEVFRERKRRGETVIFVSHDMGAVEAFCDRVLLLERGVQVDVGAPAIIVPQYHDLNQPTPEREAAKAAAAAAAANEYPALFYRFDLVDAAGNVVDGWSTDEPLRLLVELRTSEWFDGAAIRVLVMNEGGTIVGAVTSAVGVIEPDAPTVVSIELENVLGAGSYTLEVEGHAIASDTGAPTLVASPRRREAYVDGERAFGLVRIPHTASVHSAASLDAPTTK